MFIEAIKEVDRFTKPIHSIVRTYGGLISPATATLFFVNEEGHKLKDFFSLIPSFFGPNSVLR